VKNIFKQIMVLLAWWMMSLNCTHAQQDTLKYWIQFTDKNNSSYSVNQPLDFLSPQAIARRQQQNIAITEQDFPVNPSYIASIQNFASTKVIHTSRWMNAVTIECWDTLAMQNIEDLPFVAQTQVVQRLKRVDGLSEKFEGEITTSRSSDIIISNNTNFPYGVCYRQNHLHYIDYLHDLGFNGQGVHIAVIDSGFEFAHEMDCFRHVFEEGRVLSTKDFVEDDGDVFWDHYHGTAVWSTMAAYIEGVYYGTAIKASYHLLRSEAADYEHLIEEDNWVAAAEYADSAGVDIINTSLGYATFDDSTHNHSYADMDGNTTRIARAADIAASKGILLVTSAGNMGGSAWQYITTPGDADSTLTVGAVDSVGRYAFFSSTGPSSDGDIKPNVVSVGWNTYLILPWGETIVRGNGTSFSSPMMAGMAACLWQALPDFSAQELKKLIEESAHQYHQPDSLMGYGIPNFYQAYRSVTGLTYKIDPGITVLTHYPSPFNQELNLIVRSDREQEVELRGTNLLGQRIFSYTTTVQRGKNQMNILAPDWPAGLLFLTITDEQQTEVTLKLLRVE
jgi:serine protease AprX